MILPTCLFIIIEKLYRKNAHLFLLNMAIADLSITTIYIPRMIVRYTVGRWWYVKGTAGLALCRIVPFLHHVAILVSVFTILVATMDRFCAIMFPLRNIMTRKRTERIVIATWFGSAVLRFPYLIAPTLQPQGSYVICVSNLIGIFGSHRTIYERTLLSIYCTCLLATILLYTTVIIRLKTIKTPGTSNMTATTRKEQASKKLLQMMIVITLCFIFCWFIYFFAFDIFERPLNCYIRVIRFISAHANSALNPIILCFFDRQIGNSFKKTFTGMSRFRRNVKAKTFDAHVCAIQCKNSKKKSFIELKPTITKTCERSNNNEGFEMSIM